MASVYILFSESLDRFYVGATMVSVEERLGRHLSEYYPGKYTAEAKDWTLFLEITCIDMKQALSIERHIKQMKSSKYIRNLQKYPEIIAKLLVKYSP